MENFSTTRVALLPRVTNLATLAVLVTATWWSSAQRPPEQPGMAAIAATQAVATNPALPLLQAAEHALSTSGNAAHWPAQATTLPRDGLQAVGFQPRSQR